MPFRSSKGNVPVCLRKINLLAIWRNRRRQSLKSGRMGSKPVQSYTKN